MTRQWCGSKMHVELLLARRLRLNSSSGGRHSAPGVIVAIAGIALSVAIMLITIAIVTGFKHEITRKVTGFEQQITITPDAWQGPERVNAGISLNDSLKAIITSSAPGAKVYPIVSQPAVLKTENDFQGVVMKSIASGSSDAEFVSDHLLNGTADIADSSNLLVISSHTALALGLAKDSTVMAHFFIGDNLLTRRMKVAGVFDTHFSEFDNMQAFAPLKMLQKLNKVDSITGSSLAINGLDDKNIEDATNELRLQLSSYGTSLPEPEFFTVENVFTTGAMYFSWLALLDTNVAVILILMSCVAGFTLISSLFIIILERVRTIGLLKALGASDAMIRRVFIIIALRIVAVGLIIGNIVALTFIILQSLRHIIPLDPEAYYLNYVPVEISATSIIMLDIIVALLSVALLVIPSQMISTLSPSETMRYE